MGIPVGTIMTKCEKCKERFYFDCLDIVPDPFICDDCKSCSTCKKAEPGYDPMCYGYPNSGIPCPGWITK